MAFKAGQGTFEFNTTRNTEPKPLHSPQQLDPVDWHDNVDEGMKKVIADGDYLATLLRRVLASQHTPKLTINNAIDRWENTVVGFESTQVHGGNKTDG